MPKADCPAALTNLMQRGMFLPNHMMPRCAASPEVRSMDTKEAQCIRP
jgi:hypothetical protein